MDNDQAQLLGEIHATVKGMDKRLDAHLEDYKEHKVVVEKMEKRQVALFAWFSGIGVAAGGSATAFIKKIGIL